MYVINRKNQREAIRYDKINDRNIELSKGLNVDPSYLSKLVIESLKSGMTTTEIDELSAETAFYMSTYEPDYDILATRISVSNLHKQTSSSFYETVKKMYDHTNNGKKSNVISDDFMKFVEENKVELDNMINYSNDFNYNYFGFKTLTRMYLNRLNGVIAERPQHMLMRVAVCIHLNDIDSIRESYKEMSLGKFTHASPTLFNSGSARPQLASCFLLKCEDDLEHIYETNKRSALISKYGGGIGIDITNVRSKGSVIHSTNGNSDGLVPMCKVFNASANYCNQCIHPEVKVYSKAGIKRMDEITTEDYLITHDGSFKKVNEVIINEKEEDIYHIKIAGGFDILKCTKEHDIYCIKDRMRNSQKRVIDMLDSGVREPEFIPAEQVKVGYYMGFPIPTFVKDIEFTKEQCRFYGIMLGDGSIIKSPTSCRYQITLNNTTKVNTRDFVLNYIKEKGIHYWINNDCEICFTHNKETIEKIGITIDMLYDENKNKRMDPSFLHLPKHKASMLLKGLLESDGHISSSGLFYNTTDSNLIYSMRYLFLRFGILTTTQTIDNRGKTMSYNKRGKPIISRKMVYTLRIPKCIQLIDNNIYECEIDSRIGIFFTYDNILYTRVKSITKELYKGKVYDFNMIDNHNYLTDAGLVHNSGKRKGSIAMYLQPWHPDVFEFLALRYNNPPEELRARDLFTAMWIPDIFMRRVERDEMWSLFDPNVVRGLCDTYGEEFDKIYEEAEREKKYVKRVKARDVFKEIIHSQQETGLPYISYKDNINRKSNQKNIGLIRSSNLCNEINEFTDTNSVAVCNLASLSLPSFVKEREVDGEIKKYYDFNELGRITKIAVRNLNKVIDKTYYPVKEAENNNLKYRPIGLGIQGLADVFAMFRTTWENSSLSKALNQLIMEVVYYYALETSYEIAMENGSYSAFEGSPISKGEFQFDMWNAEPMTLKGQKIFGETLKLNWEELREKCKKGVRNSLLIALMPTATSSQILGNNEAFEPFTSNIYTRSTISGDFIMVNKHLARHLKELKLWDKEMVNKIIENNGSVQNIKEIPIHVRDIYRTVWEISQKIVIDFAADRGAFVDQSQSMNIFIEQPSYAKLSSMHLYGWKKGLKTGSYYIRSKPSRDAVKFSILRDNSEKKENEVEEKKEGKKYMLNGKEMICTEDVCVACSS